MPLFVISFVKPLITSCQICYFPKNRQLSTCHVLSSDLNIWPNSWLIFGILATAFFLPTKFAFIACICHFLINNAFCTRCPFLPSHLNFAKPLMDFPEFHWFRKKWHFRKNPQLTTSFFCHLVQNFCQTFDKFLPNSPF